MPAGDSPVTAAAAVSSKAAAAAVVGSGCGIVIAATHAVHPAARPAHLPAATLAAHLAVATISTPAIVVVHLCEQGTLSCWLSGSCAPERLSSPMQM